MSYVKFTNGVKVNRSGQEPPKKTSRPCVCYKNLSRELPWSTKETRGLVARPSHRTATHSDSSCPHSLLMQTTWLTMREMRAYANRGRRAIPRASYSAA